jgi:hypothetical protein
MISSGGILHIIDDAVASAATAPPRAPLLHALTSCSTQSQSSAIEMEGVFSCGVARWFILKPKNPNLGKFWSALDWKMRIYFMAICNISPTFGIFYDHMVHFVFIWYIFPVLVSCTKKNLATLFSWQSLGYRKVSDAIGQTIYSESQWENV